VLAAPAVVAWTTCDNDGGLGEVGVMCSLRKDFIGKIGLPRNGSMTVNEVRVHICGGSLERMQNSCH